MMNNLIKKMSMALVLSSLACCSQGSGGDDPAPTNPPSATNEVDYWLTKGDQTVLLQKQSDIISFSSPANTYPNLDIDVSKTYQTIDGFGYTLTGGSVQVINTLTESKKQELLQNVFGTADGSIGVSYLRLSIGASDLNSEAFTYDDMPAGETDENLQHFNMSKDQPVIDLLKKILAINPEIKIIATPWSAPAWMKDNASLIGGSLKTEYYATYAQYFVRYIQTMKQNGIDITAITPQNEPLNPNNNPSLAMSAQEQAAFIKNHLGPAFRDNGIATKIVIYDHNCDKPEYPTSILSDKEASPYIDGSAFHLYGGDISVLSNLHTTFPTKNLYFTEQWTQSTGDFSGDLQWHLKNVIVGSMRNWSKIALEWNLANDPNYKPHTDGGCSDCKGAVTVTSSETYAKNVAYYIIAHASRFVPAGSVRVQSSELSGISNVAFKTPAGKIALVCANDQDQSKIFNLRINGKWAVISLPAKSVATYVF